MKSKKTIFILSIAVIVIVVIGLGVLMNGPSKPGKLDDFAKSLKSNGAEFYGAFWCPHCQAQKAEFGSSEKYLPYIECSNPDNTPTQICIDKKIEGYPTWKFKNGITINSSSAPIVCQVKPGVKGESELCTNVSSQYYKTWIFPEYQFSIKSPTDPIKAGNVWKFPSEAEATGEIPLSFLAQQIGYTLPQ
ncbi:MAG TPA: hypothetical protein VMR49_01610 [Candidatus Paceibacterota bacterium]|jgi:thiol-disulfide isomerase/thioredoxin|nr:hypothetical protein [Candidatus Paceibacterota bacterium]